MPSSTTRLAAEMICVCHCVTVEEALQLECRLRGSSAGLLEVSQSLEGFRLHACLPANRRTGL